MKMSDFAANVLAIVRDKADGSFNAWLTASEKNNGIMLTGITTVNSDSNISPCIYLDSYYEKYRNEDITIDEAAEAVYGNIMKQRNHVPDFNVADLLRWDYVKTSICAKLVNAELNKHQLIRIPHRIFMDLAVVYYISVDEVENGVGTILIQNDHMKLWGQDENALYETALKNMKASGNIMFEDMMSFITQYSQTEKDKEAPENFKMYVLTNQSKCYGASGILDHTTLHRISEQIGDFIVLPSSIHEVIVIPKNEDMGDYSRLAAMVKEVNAAVVLPEERLSDHVYVYSRDNEKLRIAA